MPGLANLRETHARRLRKICQVLSIISAAYLQIGLIQILVRMPVPVVVAGAYAIAFVLGLLAIAAAFAWSPKTFLALALWSIGLTVPVLQFSGAEKWRVCFPGVIDVGAYIYLDFKFGRVSIGVNLVSCVLFIILAVCGSKLVKLAKACFNLPQS